MQEILGVQVRTQDRAPSLGDDQRSIDGIEQAGGDVEIDSRIRFWVRAGRLLQAIVVVQAHRSGSGFGLQRHISSCSSARTHHKR